MYLVIKKYIEDKMKNQLKNDMYKKILDNISDGVYFVDKERKIEYWNNGAEKITGYKQKEVLDSNCFDDLLCHCSDSGDLLCKNNCPLSFTLKDGKEREAEVYLRHKDGSRVPVKIKVSPVYDENNEITGAVEIFSDNSETLSAYDMIEQLRKLAFFDDTTNIPNRKFLDIKLNQHLNDLKENNLFFGIILIRFANYNNVKCSASRETADTILKIIAKTLDGVLAPFHILGRYDEDTFMIILPKMIESDFKDFEQRIKNIVNRCSFGLDFFSEKKEDSIKICFSGTVVKSREDIENLVI